MRANSVWNHQGWRLLSFRKAMLHLSLGLVISALAAGLYQNRVYFTFAACAVGAVLWARAWWDYCAWRDGKPLRRPGKSVPYMLRRNKRSRPHRPAFFMTSEDFDDDLTPFTTASEESFTDTQCRLASAFSCFLAGGLMIAVSFVI